ncbi:MAG: hypothetical protein ABF629_08580 [Sporolactobacillus sp.]
MPEHIIITYSSEKAQTGHVDPNFTKLVYGDSNQHGNILKKHLTPGSYLFFNTRIGNSRYITSYFYVEKLLEKEKDFDEIKGLHCSAESDEVIVIGSRNFSKVLTSPLIFDQALLQKITSYGADEDYFVAKAANGDSELKAIKDKTLTPKLITDEEMKLLLHLCENRG